GVSGLPVPPSSTEAARLAGQAMGRAALARMAHVLVLILTLGSAALGTGALLQMPGHALEPVAAMADPAEQAKPAARPDLHGDPLPAGEVNRLGTVRQRAPGAQIAVTADGKEIVAVNSDLVIRSFDAATGELRATARLPRPSAAHLWLSPRGSYVLT